MSCSPFRPGASIMAQLLICTRPGHRAPTVATQQRAIAMVRAYGLHPANPNCVECVREALAQAVGAGQVGVDSGVRYHPLIGHQPESGGE